jgi:glyoxylase-like metal-dependent hydrolase (beta-lactamase superfamily II)
MTSTRLVDLGDGCHAYLQGEGGWGWSNSGLVVGDGASMLVDTLFDLRLTGRLLEAIDPLVRPAPLGTVVNTHANGDHCYGNQLVSECEIVSTTAAAEEMLEVPASLLAALCDADGEVGELFRHFFGEFDFTGIKSTPPTRTFSGRLELDIGGRSVEIVEVGPAHTRGDAVVFVPDARCVFTGDILFIGGTPVVWAGPIENWIAACDVILGSDCDTIVPGHGPVTDASGVVAVRDYLSAVLEGAVNGLEAGRDAWDVAREMAGRFADGEHAKWGEFGRLAVNVDTVYRTRMEGHRSPDVVEQFRRMRRLETSRHGDDR